MMKLLIASRNDISLFNELDQNTRKHKICILICFHFGFVFNPLYLLQKEGINFPVTP